MRRWGRILLNTLTAISLLLAIATAGLWVLTIVWRFERFWWVLRPSDPATVTYWEVHLEKGQIRIDSHVGIFPWSGPDIYDRLMLESYSCAEGVVARIWPPSTEVSFLRTRDRLQLLSPFSIPFCLFACIPAMRGVLKLASRSKKAQGHCPACGYDMRANPAKCSECGFEMKLDGDSEGEPFTSGDVRG